MELAEKYDNDPGLLIDPKLQIHPDNRTKAGSEMKKLYTNTSFVSDKAAFIKVKQFLIFNILTLK